MRRLFFPGLILALSAPALVLRAQDFQHEGPKAVPPQAPPAAASNAPLARPVDDNQVLVPRLQALVFVASPKDVVLNGTEATGVELRKVEVPAPKKFQALVSP